MHIFFGIPQRYAVDIYGFYFEEYILGYLFITGVSKFSKVSLFSGLNNLKDITIDKRFSDICGYTQDELESVFSGWIGDTTDLVKVKTWNNGYSWLGREVYNPFDILLYLDSGEFRNFWFEIATPTFLIRLLQEKNISIRHCMI